MTNKNYIKIIETEQELSNFYETCCAYTENPSTIIPSIVLSKPKVVPVHAEFFLACGVDRIYDGVDQKKIDEVLQQIAAEKKNANEKEKKKKKEPSYKMVQLLKLPEVPEFKDFLVSALEDHRRVPFEVIVVGRMPEDDAGFMIDHGVHSVACVHSLKTGLDMLHKDLQMLMDECMADALNRAFDTDDAILSELVVTE